MPLFRLTTLLCLVFCAALAACGKEDAGGGRQQPPATVTTLRVQPVRWSDELTALGTAKARESVTITASVSQTVDKINFDSGEFAERGQPLVTLTQSQQSASVAAAQAEVRDAEQLYERNRRLADQQLISRASLDTQRAALEAARARVAAERATVADRVIRAPFDGVLGLRLVSEGTLVTPGTVITTLDDVSLIRLDFTVPESALSQVAVGQRINARSDAWPGETFSGLITSIDSRVDPVTRAVTARADIPNPDRKLRPGMLLEVGVERSARETLAIPELAVQQSGTQASVFRVDGDKAREVPVEVGARHRGEVEILSGLKAGDRIVVEGTVKLRDGAAIKDVGTPAASPAAAASSNGR
jgi:membrane fusion protein, multidrug efflux system